MKVETCPKRESEKRQKQASKKKQQLLPDVVVMLSVQLESKAFSKHS